MKKLYIILISVAMLTTACSEEFLDVPPSVNSSLEITTVEQIDLLFNGMFLPQGNDYVNTFCTDNTYIPQAVVDQTFSFSNEVQQQYTFDVNIDRDSDSQWAQRYSNVLLPNLAIELIESGELEGDDEDLKTLLKAEAHFLRALHFFEMAVVYSLYPSSENGSEQGIVLRETSSYEESLSRSTLSETFDFILADLEEALNYPFEEKKYFYRIGKPSVHALAARVYLYLGDYDMAKTHADAALSGNNTMINFSDSVYPFTGTLWYGDFAYANTASQTSYGGTSIADFWEDQYYFFLSSNPAWNTSPSQELMDLYDPADIRNLFYVEDWFTRSGATEGWFTYMNTYVGTTLSGPGVPEMYLTRAECKARNNDIAGAMQDVEMVRINRFHPEDYAPLPIPGSVKAAVEEIVNERRREDPFEYRFMDIKRLNNDPITDPITINRSLNGETTTIQPDDRRWARPIGADVIQLSGGVTQQNQY